jgi:predicted house-cleaning NTP pyrophosphatase (Maf/HAM1 superfamily)
MATDFALVLGSKSRGRRACLAEAGYTFTVQVADIDEKAVRVGAEAAGADREAADPTQVP